VFVFIGLDAVFGHQHAARARWAGPACIFFLCDLAGRLRKFPLFSWGYWFAGAHKFSSAGNAAVTRTMVLRGHF
jgi:hypothetical protein